MAGKGCCRGCCIPFLSQVWGIFKGGMLLLIYEIIGWALFSYVEDNLNIIDCFNNQEKVQADHYPAIVNETKRAGIFFAELAKKTNQSLNHQQAAEMYFLYRGYYNVPNPTPPPPKSLVSYKICFKWYRFAVVTITTIGYGSVTPKTDAGKLLVIPYALIGIPMMLAYLAFIGSILSHWTDGIMMCMHRIIKGNVPIKYKSIKHCLYLFVAMWVIIVLATLDFVFQPHLLKSWLDGIYFYFVTFTTIGFGDISAPAENLEFYGLKLFFGLSIVSGVVDSFLKLNERLKFKVTGVRSCTCCTYVEEDNPHEEDSQDPAVVQETHL